MIVNKKVLVDNLTTSSLIIVPSQVKDYVTTANQLSKILGCSKEKILEKVKKKVSVERIQPEGRQLTEEKAYQLIV